MGGGISRMPTAPTFSPEPFASMTDVLTAAQYVEKAIHAKTVTELQDNMNSAIEFLGYASDYLKLAGLPQYQAEVDNVIKCYHGLLSHLNTVSLQTFQTQYLYTSMANMSRLYSLMVLLLNSGIAPTSVNICSAYEASPQTTSIPTAQQQAMTTQAANVQSAMRYQTAQASQAAYAPMY